MLNKTQRTLLAEAARSVENGIDTYHTEDFHRATQLVVAGLKTIYELLAYHVSPDGNEFALWKRTDNLLRVYEGMSKAQALAGARPPAISNRTWRTSDERSRFYAVACEQCGAQPGSACVDPLGTLAQWVHGVRHQAAEDARAAYEAQR